MRTLYLDCGMGAAGDMLTAALLELFPDREAVVAQLNALGIPGVEFRAESAVKCGITGTHMSVLVHGAEEGEALLHDHDHEHPHAHDHDHAHEHAHEDPPHGHSHRGLDGIEHILRDHLYLPEQVRKDVLAVYGLLAQAESRVHGVPVSEIHFHEVGTLDAIADITAVCWLMRKLAPERVAASAIHVGSGQVRCAHGLLPVPAPATALLLQDIPIYGGSIRGELCTPTGAALLRYFVQDFGPMPPLRVRAIGYGMGKKDFPAANCLRAMLGDTEERTEEIWELSCNVDDMTGEALGFALEQLLAEGALEAYTVAIGMKKSRPGVLLRVLCRPEDRQNMAALLLRHTTTLGVREQAMGRYTLERSTATVETPWGPVRRKTASGFGVRRQKYEYEDLARIAREQGLSLEELRRQL